MHVLFTGADGGIPIVIELRRQGEEQPASRFDCRAFSDIPIDKHGRLLVCHKAMAEAGAALGFIHGLELVSGDGDGPEVLRLTVASGPMVLEAPSVSSQQRAGRAAITAAAASDAAATKLALGRTARSCMPGAGISCR